MKKLIHFIPHFGGGAGVVLTALIDALAETEQWSQEVICFEYLNDYGKTWSHNAGIKVHSQVPISSVVIPEFIQQADVVLFHFWNHPLALEFMRNISGCHCRLIMWAYVNGMHSPYEFSKEILDFPSKFVVSTPYSLKAKIDGIDIGKYSPKISHVFMTAGIRGYDSVQHINGSKLTVGYVGTVDYVKLHKNFINICKNVGVDNVRFVVCGGNKHHEIACEAKLKAASLNFVFTGPIKNVAEMLATFDVFAYPLNRLNYGTGEQVLIEAMSAGVPQVVFGDGPEEYIVKNKYTGLAVNSEDEFSGAINNLLTNKRLRGDYSDNSRKYAQEKYSKNTLLRNWEAVFNEVMLAPPTTCRLQYDAKRMFPNTGSNIAVQLYLIGIGNRNLQACFNEILSYYPKPPPDDLLDKIRALPDIFHSETRGSINHYLTHLNSLDTDKRLRYLHDLLRSVRDDGVH